MKTHWLLLPTAGLVTGGIAGWLWPQPEELWIMDVGQGDCAVLRHAGLTILIDDGPVKRFGDPDRPVVLEALRRRGIDSVDLILLSHPDMDHVGGTGALLQRFPNARIAVSADFMYQPKLDKDIAAWHAAGAVAWLPERADVKIPGCTLHIDCPPVTLSEDDNRGCMFVRVDDGGATADFSGDAPADVEQQEAKQGDWHADLLHVGHHGSRTATGLAWLAAVKPRFAAISCGRDNPYGHPHQQTLNRLIAAGIRVERTDLQGDLLFVPRSGHFVPGN